VNKCYFPAVVGGELNMENAAPCFSLNLLGPFRLLGPGGERIEIPSKKGAALIAMLATAREGEHTRGWLQDKLWGTREATQARASLRRELSNLRSRLNRATWELLICEREVVRLNLDLVAVDIRSLDLAEGIPGGPHDFAPGEFFEGQDIAGEDGFEEWLREQRSALGRHTQRGDARLTDANKVRSATTLAIPIVDVSQPPAGFHDSSALAVLRFKNLSGDPVNDYIAEGASEDLIDRLSRIRWLPVIARSSSFSFPEDTDPNEIGRKLGARYVLHGRLRYGAESLWISADLADSTNGYTIWTKRFELRLSSDGFSLERLIDELAALLEDRIDHAEQMRARSKKEDSAGVRDIVWRGRWHLNRLTRRDGEIAQRLFSEALALDPDSSEALIQATYSMAWSLWAGRASQKRILDMTKLAQRAILADHDDGRGHMLAGIAEMWLRRPLAARALFKQAIDLNPSLALAHAVLGCSYNLGGEPDKGLEHIKTGKRLSPNDVHLFFYLAEMAMAYFILGRWSDAIENAEHALGLRPAYWYAHVIKISALSRSGERAKAEVAMGELLRTKPKFNMAYLEWIPFLDKKWTDYLMHGLSDIPLVPIEFLTEDGPSAPA
jgi:TolB-like protein